MTLLHTALPTWLVLEARDVSTTPPHFNYSPVFAVAIIFVVLYAITLVSNLIQFFWYRSWFWWPMLLAVASTSPFSSLL
jgi:hypothetical protein